MGIALLSLLLGASGEIRDKEVVAEEHSDRWKGPSDERGDILIIDHLFYNYP